MSFQITLTPSRKAAARFVVAVRRALQRAYVEEQANGLTQTTIAKTIGVHRSVINRELRGAKDITLGRVAELASAMGRVATLELAHVSAVTDMKLAAASSMPPGFDWQHLLNTASANTAAQYLTFDTANNNLAPVPRLVAL
jgi:plasmid maintenance system antidote protein VapI